MTARARAFLWLLLTLAPAGCSPGPQAPALQNGPVYENAKEGVQFLVPEGWVQLARSDTPPGRIAQPLLLVAYHFTNSGRRAELELYRVDLPEGTDLGRYIAGHPVGPFQWEPQPPQPLVISGTEATRFPFTRKAGKAESVREVVAFRRGERVYLFTATAAAEDEPGREQVRQALNSVRWTK